MESCPFCRRVREALSELDLDWVCHPTPKGSGLREDTPRWNGRYSFPFLRDPSTGVEMKESEAILDYLHDTYGAGRPHSARLTRRFDLAGSMLASGLRPKGMRTDHGDRTQPAKPLELWQYEGCPYSRKVRERLHTLCLEVVVRNVALGSPKRATLVARGGKMQVPFLIDSSRGVALYESEDILAYLDSVYAR